MKRLSQSLCLAAWMAGSLLSAATLASAETIYGEGSTATFSLNRTWFDCYGKVLDSSRYPARYRGTGKPIECQNASPIDSSALFAYAPAFDGAGTHAFVTQQSVGFPPSDTPYENATLIYDESTSSPLSHQGVGYGLGGASRNGDFFDFSDSAMPQNQDISLKTYASVGTLGSRGPAIQIPSVGMPVAIAYNATGLTFPSTRTIPTGAKTATGGSGKLYLSRKSYCGIFTGAIRYWDDPSLTADNEGTVLAEHKPIQVIVRPDANGNTFLLSRHLKEVCDGSESVGHYFWTGGVGATVIWRVGLPVIGDKTVADRVASTDGAIGYVSPSYTQQVDAPQTSSAPVAANLQTRSSFEAGELAPAVKPIPPAPTYTQNAVAGFIAPTINTAANWSAALDTTILRNPPNTSATANSEAYPIAGFALLDLYNCYFPAAETTTLKGFINWYTISGNNTPDTIARNNGFAPLTNVVKAKVRAYATIGPTALKTGPVSGTCTISSGT